MHHRDKIKTIGPKKHVIRRHAIIVILIPLLITACAGFIYWFTSSTEASIASSKEAFATQLEQDDKTIKQILARKAAELQAKQQAEAKDSADKAATATNSTAGTIDSATCNRSTVRNNPAEIDVIVNKKHCIQPLTFIPNDLVSSRGATLSAKAIGGFNGLMAAADAAGVPLSVTSSYRSYTTQISTYAYWVGISGAAGADTYSARPGYSEHQTGLAFDVATGGCALDCFGTSQAYTWMQANAATYGFIQRYYQGFDLITGYKAEEWHYRYVGSDVALDMQAKSIKTLEEYWGVAGGNYY